MGDTYNVSIMLIGSNTNRDWDTNHVSLTNRDSIRYRVCSWGDIVERGNYD